MAGELRDIKQSKGLDPVLGIQLAMLDRGTEEYREGLGKVSQDLLRWQPYENGHSIGVILLHIADAEAYWFEEVASGRERDPKELKKLLSVELDQYVPTWPKAPKKPLLWFYEQQDIIRARTRKIVKELADPATKGYSNYSKRHYTLRWILHHVIQHEAYHIGQAVLLTIEYAKRKKA
jgi:uncharacterized damage-inducible protein DinB